MNKALCSILTVLVLLIAIPVHAEFDASVIPEPLSEEMLSLSAETKDSEYTLTGIRFDLDDENMPVIIIKQKQKNISNRSIHVSGDLWIFSHDPNASGGSALTGAGSHYKKDYLGSWRKNGKRNKDIKEELAPDEEYEFEYPYQIESFSKPVYMYFITEQNSINEQWKNETIVVIPETSTVKPLIEKK